MLKKLWRRIGIYMVLYLLSVPVCRLRIAECYPLIPVYTAVLYLSERGRKLVIQLLLFVLFLLLPMGDAVKHGVIVICITCGMKLFEWINKKSSNIATAGIAGISTILVSLGGEILMVVPRVDYVVTCLEGVFVMAATLSLSSIMPVLPQEEEESMVQEGGGQQRKLYEYAASFQKLASVFARMNQGQEDFAREDYERMQEEVAGKICFSCDQCALCWEDMPGRENGMAKLFRALLESMQREDMEGRGRGLRRQLQEYCPNAEHVTEEMLAVFEKAKLNMAWYNRLIENREAIAQQLDAMAYIMQDCMRVEEDVSVEYAKQLRRMRVQLAQNGMRVSSIKIYRKKNGKIQLQLRAATKSGNFVSVREVARGLSSVLHRSIVPGRDCRTLLGKEEECLILEEEPCYQELHGVARMTKTGECVSGDNFTVIMRSDGEIIYGLSDGMGAGIQACKESELVVELMEGFLEAGFSVSTALRMMNSTMVLHGENRQFSTVDLAEMNLYDGTCMFYKVGAAATFVRHKGRYECLLSENLPTGVTCHLNVVPQKRTLADNDWIVMVTDGVLEYLNVDRPEEEMIAILNEIDTQNPTQFARAVLERVLLEQSGEAKDDMTVLCAGIWKKSVREKKWKQES